MHPVTLYFREARTRFFYFVTGFSAIWIVALFKFNSIALVLVISLEGASTGKFLISHPADLINTTMDISYQVGVLASFPFFCVQLRLFMSNCLYSYQLLILAKYQKLMMLNFFFYTFLIYWVLMPSIIIFSLRWFEHMNIWIFELNLLLELNVYMQWYMRMYHSFVTILYLTLFYPLCLALNLCPTAFYLFVKHNKKYIFFVLVALLFFLNSLEYGFQLILIILAVLFTECLFFYTCLKKASYSW